MAKEKTISFSRGDDWRAGGQPAKDLKTDFEAQSGEWDIHFQVGHPTGRFEFTKDPFWVRKMDGGSDDQCPTGMDCPNEFEVVDKPGNGRTRLTVRNKNNEPGDYRYQLNVYDRKNDEYVPIDPILSNGGHGIFNN